MTLLVGVDGTGPLTDAEYRPGFSNSFVHYICTHTSLRQKWYRRGPSAAGLGTPMIVSEGYSWCELRCAARREPILLTGYSRGAAAVVAIAQGLARAGIPVAGMVLFDCVDRAIGLDAARIPRTVDRVVHVRRDPSAGSRESFGQAGTIHSPPTRYEQRFFHGTHGAMGGCHWRGGQPDALIDEGMPDYGTNVSYAQDLAAAREVWRWVQPRLRAMGFEITMR